MDALKVGGGGNQCIQRAFAVIPLFLSLTYLAVYSCIIHKGAASTLFRVSKGFVLLGYTVSTSPSLFVFTIVTPVEENVN